MLRWVAAVLLMGCSAAQPQPTPGLDTTIDLDGASDSETLTTLCEPATVSGCSDDNTAMIRCTADGQSWQLVACVDADGMPTLCNEGQCLVCFPGKRRCRDEDNVDICNEDGTGWIQDHSCNGTLTGQVCETGTCIGLCELSLKWNTYMGCEYWGADLDNGYVEGHIDGAGAQYAVIVSNPHASIPAEVTIENSEGPVLADSDGQPFPVGKLLPGTLRVYRLPRRDVDGTVLSDRAYRIQSSIPTTVYQFNPLANEEVYSNDASLLLPVNVLDRWYFVMTREQGFEGIRAYLTVIGTHDATDVTITVTGSTIPGNGLPALEAGESLSRSLNAFDVLNLETAQVGDDLTGSQVVSSRRVAVFGGSEGANVPNTNHCNLQTGVCEADSETSCETHLDCQAFVTCCADHIEEQMLPVDTWGTAYVCARTKQRGSEAESWRVVAADNNTVLTTTPPQGNFPVLDAGEWIEFESLDHFELTASKPVMVGHFMHSEHAPNPGIQSGDAAIGDPAFLLAIPTIQYRKETIILSPPDFEQSWLNVVSPASATVFLNETVLNQPCAPIGTGEYCLRAVSVPAGNHSVRSEEPIGVTVYGYDQYVSYGYPGGLDLTRMDILTPPTGPYSDGE